MTRPSRKLGASLPVTGSREITQDLDTVDRQPEQPILDELPTRNHVALTFRIREGHFTAVGPLAATPAALLWMPDLLSYSESRMGIGLLYVFLTPLGCERPMRPR